MGLGRSSIRRLEGYAVDPVADADGPSVDSAGSEIVPLDRADWIVLVAWVIKRFNFGEFTYSGGHLGFPSFSVELPSCLGHFTATVA